mmetsp:Transcript_57904/g.134920  ORF Transcript_57904/g.134920 Transcript_57904/m.134920 type:complete len:291 (+) Transcript_57904:110-982(+)
MVPLHGPGPTLRGPHANAAKVILTVLAIGAATVSLMHGMDGMESLAFVLAGRAVADRNPVSVLRGPERAGGVPMQATIKVLRPWIGSSKYKTYEGYVFRRKHIPGVHLRLDRGGTGKFVFYRIKAAFAKSKKHSSGRFLEKIGWYDPNKEVDHPKFFKLRCDRAVYWLRNGAQPTDMVANLLDRAGIIRRTGPLSKTGEWEWRIDKNSGPSAPEGWSYDGPHEVTWNNMPMIKHRRGHPTPKGTEKVPLIEKYGFKGYSKIPLDNEMITNPLYGNHLLETFENTELTLWQ